MGCARARRVVLVIGIFAAACSDSGVAERSESAATPDSLSVELPCRELIDKLDGPPAGYSIVLEVVALPTSDAAPMALAAKPSSRIDPTAPLFAKTGLVIRTDTTFDLVVPDEAADLLQIGWGSPAERARRVGVDRCRGVVDDPGDAIDDVEPTRKWLAYAGGFWVSEVGCYPLVVRPGEREQRVTVGVGAPCPG